MLLSAGCVLGLHASSAIVVSVQLAPPSVEKPTPMPCAPPFDLRSWCHMAIALLPCTATCGSTSALGYVLPVSELSN